MYAIIDDEIFAYIWKTRRSRSINFTFRQLLKASNKMFNQLNIKLDLNNINLSRREWGNLICIKTTKCTCRHVNLYILPHEVIVVSIVWYCSTLYKHRVLYKQQNTCYQFYVTTTSQKWYEVWCILTLSGVCCFGYFCCSFCSHLSYFWRSEA